MNKLLLSGLLTLAVSSIASAEVKLASVFMDHGVLQRDIAVPVWGTATTGKKVTIKAGTSEASATADESGKFMVKLPAMKLGDPIDLTASEEGGNTVILHDIAIGDVWVCGGQSNMGFQLRQASNGKDELTTCADKDLRLLRVQQDVAPDAPQSSIAGGAWKPCDAASANEFSAVGYFFGKELRHTQKVPIGLIGSYWGGTPAESWTTWQTLEANPDFKPILERYKENLNGHDRQRVAFAEKVKQWEEKKKADPNFKGAKPQPIDVKKSPHSPAVLYNGMIAPLVPYAIKGAIWYQGEANTLRAEQYRTLFPAMIADWRHAWSQGDFPFLFVQLANYTAHQDKPEGSPWAELREAQTMTLKNSPNTGMAVIIDVGNPGNIHPTDKQTPGHRLALVARKMSYGEQNVVMTGPTFKSLQVAGNRVTVEFSSVGEGLVAKGGEVKGFTIAGADKKFVPATGMIEGNTVVVRSPEVESPVAVRYGWAENPTANLYNSDDLPASPFRTDDWPGVTAGSH